MALMTLISCEKNTVVAPLPYDTQLSVECILVPGETPILHLGETVAYFDSLVSNLDLFVDDAIVTIRSEGVIDTLVSASRFNSYRCRDEFFYQGSIAITQGKKYHLQIEHGGDIYEADTEMNVDPAHIDSVSYVTAFVDLYGEHEGVVVSYTDLPNQRNQYRYRMDRILDPAENPEVPNCSPNPYAATEIGRSVYFDTHIDGASLTIVIEPAFKHIEGNEGIVRLQTLDLASARFFNDLDLQKNAKINPFIEPVFIRSNISGAFGIFGASNYSAPVSFIFPE